MNESPIYPFSISTRYRLICPKGAAGICQGCRTYRTRHTLAVYYCHDRMCRELFPQMLPCPCEKSEICRGNHWEGERHVCNRREEGEADED